jgi:hypothetical protein
MKSNRLSWGDRVAAWRLEANQFFLEMGGKRSVRQTVEPKTSMKPRFMTCPSPFNS